MSQQVSGDTLRRGLRVLGVAIREEPRIFAGAIAGSLVFAVMTVATAWVLGQVTEYVILPAYQQGRVGAAALGAATAAILGVAVFKVVGVIGRRVLSGMMQFRLQATYRRRVTRQYLRLPLSWHHRHPTGQLLSNANADVEATWMPIAPMPLAIGVIIMLIVAGVAMVLVDIVIAFVGFLVFPAVGFLNFIYQRRLSPLVTRAQQLRAEVSGIAHESFDGALVVKTLGREDDETSRFRDSSHDLRDANIAVGKVRGLFDPVMDALPNLGVLAVLFVGAVRVDIGAMTAGELVEIAYLFTLLAFPIRALGWVLAELPRSVVGWDRVSHVLESTGSLSYGEASVSGEGGAKVATREMAFAYDSQDVLSDVSLDVAPGSTIAVVGPTGSGKSTLASLLVRLVDPRSGQVFIDATDVRDVRLGGMPAATALVPQQTFLFDDDVFANVAAGLDISDDDVWQALRLAQADRFVGELPSGLGTHVGERGTSLSGGQRQRIALARALVRRPRLLVLDDATSSVDPQVEARILQGLRKADLPSTVVVVAYRMATIMLADEIVYFERGRLSDRGTHDELLDRSEGYRRLVTAYERAEAERRALEAEEVA